MIHGKQEELRIGVNCTSPSNTVYQSSAHRRSSHHEDRQHTLDHDEPFMDFDGWQTRWAKSRVCQIRPQARSDRGLSFATFVTPLFSYFSTSYSFPIIQAPFLLPDSILRFWDASHPTDGLEDCKMPNKTYPLTVNSWRAGRDAVVVFCRISHQLIGSFPLEFVRQSGVDSWQYVLDAIDIMVEPSPGHTSTLWTVAGVMLDLTQTVDCGEFFFEQLGDSSSSPRLGA